MSLGILPDTQEASAVTQREQFLHDNAESLVRLALHSPTHGICASKVQIALGTYGIILCAHSILVCESGLNSNTLQ